MNLPLLNDMTRCYGFDCDKWETCARCQTMAHDKPDTKRSYANQLCFPVDGKAQDYYIEVKER